MYLSFQKLSASTNTESMYLSTTLSPLTLNEMTLYHILYP